MRSMGQADSPGQCIMRSEVGGVCDQINNVAGQACAALSENDG